MDHAHLYNGLAAGQRGVHAGEMVLYRAVFFIPRALVTDGSGVVALGFALHCVPREMRHAHRDAQRRLPVALMAVQAEIRVPAGHAVELRKRALTAELVHRALALLCGGKFVSVAQQVDARQPEAAVRAHCLAYGCRLAPERRLLHHMAGE